MIILKAKQLIPAPIAIGTVKGIPTAIAKPNPTDAPDALTIAITALALFFSSFIFGDILLSYN
ncbi:hypothetical protein [Tenacibaculum sp. Ill]|uniref:hypothetical protein n=1 Tax=Tenacibaculum sp. Ill TaxID=3445935 RepID=UPI003F78EE1E